MSEHTPFIMRAIELAGQAVEKGNHPFGAVLVRDGQIVLEAENTVHTDRDVTRHAELNLVSNASSRFSLTELKQSTLYTSTEPCPMCSGAIYWAGISRVVYACPAATLQDIAGPGMEVHCRELFERSHKGPEVIGPLKEEVASEQHLSFWPHPS
ncbi:nucleoside deaminase [Endozoicomonadaceae bacterium StTr2]